MKNFTLLLLLLIGFSWSTFAQETEPETEVAEEEASVRRSPTPKSMWEITPHGGYLFISGDVKSKGGWGAGLSIRKATDYIFSLRLDFLMGQAKGETKNNAGNIIRSYTNDWMSSTLFGVFSFNSLNYNKPVRNTNIYAMAGAGLNWFKVPNYTNEEYPTDRESPPIDRETGTHVTLGAGMSFRLGGRVNIGAEYQATSVFGNRADLLDGTDFETAGQKKKGLFRDIVSYPNIRININLGSKTKRSEPLYWINPLEVVLNEMGEIREAQERISLADSDGDGVIDELDQESNTPTGALVDTKGRTLDSDRDGVPDYLDKEPYYTPRQGERVNSEGVVENPIGTGVTEDRVRELIDEALQNYQPQQTGGVTDLFLPMIHFAVDSKTIKYSDYGTLSSIARVMKNDPNLRMVVKGYTDQTGNENSNTILSYERANAVIEHLVNNHGIGRGRFILQYGGQAEALVPLESSYMNRRVEFSVAGANDVEMDPPAGYTPGKSGGY